MDKLPTRIPHPEKGLAVFFYQKTVVITYFQIMPTQYCLAVHYRDQYYACLEP